MSNASSGIPGRFINRASGKRMSEFMILERPVKPDYIMRRID
jgi:hypothetical protein